jgi:hypothetical protein
VLVVQVHRLQHLNLQIFLDMYLLFPQTHWHRLDLLDYMLVVAAVVPKTGEVMVQLVVEMVEEVIALLQHHRHHMSQHRLKIMIELK